MGTDAETTTISSSAAAAVDGCPVKHGINPVSSSTSSSSTTTTSGTNVLGSSSSSLWSFWSKVSNNSSTTTTDQVSGTTGQQNPTPSSIEEAARYAQTPQPDQKIQLSIHRQVSSIPRIDLNTNLDGTVNSTSSSSTSTCPVTTRSTNDKDSASAVAVPTHQLGETNDKWIYPSEQQLYNAMRKKGWNNIPEDTIPTVLAIHNNVNEMTWSKIVKWEGTSNLYLSKFQGRPRDISPKAFFFSYIIPLYDEPPFDRHDWYIKHSNSSSNTNSDSIVQRYVIDYYYLKPAHPNLPPIPYIDARPALDNPRAFGLRLNQLLCDIFPGITTFLKRQQQNQLMNKDMNKQDNNNNNNK